MLLRRLNVLAILFVEMLLCGNHINADSTMQSTVSTSALSQATLPAAEFTHLTASTTLEAAAAAAEAVTAKEEEIQSFDETFATTSFGIRSFTVEVTTASEKPPLFQLHDHMSTKTPTNFNVSKVKAALSKKLKAAFAFTASTQPPPQHEDGNKVPVRADSMKPTPQTTQPLSTSGTASVRPSNSQLNEKELINDMHVEHHEQGMLKNGMYRIQIAEIITDEFDNGLGDATENDVKQRLAVSGAQNKLYNDGKINIADLYPSKLEDFGPIIKQSNEKLINDKHVFVINDGNDEYKPYTTIELAPSKDSINSAKGANIPTTKIEIELIDPDVDGAKSIDKVTDFTSQLLQDNDNFINTIERSFVINGNGVQSAPTHTSNSINKPIETQTFIDRRVKKHDQSFRTQFDVPMHLDVGKAKINQDLLSSHKNSNDSVTSSTNDKPEFSTTKFYNSKELYSELLHKKIPDEEKPTTITTTIATPRITTVIPARQLTATTVRTSISPNKMNRKMNKSKNILQEKGITMAKTIKLHASSTQALEQKTPTLPTKSITVAASQASTTTIATKPTSTKTTTFATPATTTTVTTTATAITTTTTTTSAAIAAATVSVTDITKRPIRFASVTPLATTTVSPMLGTGVAAAAAAAAGLQTKALSSRPRVVSRLQDKINSLECDMQNELTESNVWRGNETHELCLPNTIPENCLSGSDCMPMVISWEGTAEIQSGDVLIVEIDDTLLIPIDFNNTNEPNVHKATTTVYQVTRPGHEHCDVTEGVLLDITPLDVDGKKLVTLYDKDLTEGVNLLIVVSELWGQQCVRLKVTVKSDNCGENADCSGKGICYSNASMEGYECQCCTGFAGSHCEEIDACSPSPCTNNGICVDLSQGHEGNSYQCLCPYGYTGKNCQFESDPCNPSECLNGGSCAGNTTHFRCECAAGFTGPLCQHNLNECESSPCVHGICVDQEDGFRCFCQPGFSGELCNFEYNECESNPCLNGAQCSDHIGGFSCKCTRGYTGKRCHVKVDFCANNPCPEGHRCNDRGDDFTCDCPGGRNGPDCNQVPRTLCNINPCANGGTCWTSEESFYCACRPGFTGKMCEDEFVVETVVSSNEILSDDPGANARPFGDSSYGAVVSKGPIGLYNAYIAAGTFITAIFIVAIVVIVCHCKFHQSYRRFTTRHHQLIPIFGFGRRSKSSTAHRHWLSGKGGFGGSGGNIDAAASNTTTGSGGFATGSMGGGNNNGTHGMQSKSSATSALHYHHGGRGQDQNNIGLNQHGRQQQEHRNNFNRHLAMNLENDMYYTVDFSDNQHSPLIH